MKIVIDVDTGVDDAHSIMMALAHPSTEVLAITCVNGNARIENVLKNTLKVIDVCGRSEVPVYKGCEMSILGKEYLADYHGSHGLGDLVISENVDLTRVKKQHAVLFLLDLVNKYPGEISLVALAPLTNIATALKIDPKFGDKTKELIIMGGNIHGVGNRTVSSEFNFYVDPEAAFIVLQDINCHIKLVSWETCCSNILDWDWAEKWLKTDTNVGRFNQIISMMGYKSLKNTNSKGYRSCDVMAMAACLEPSAILESEHHICTVELKGEFTRGQMILDRRPTYNRHDKATPNVEIITKIDTKVAQELLDAAVQGVKEDV